MGRTKSKKLTLLEILITLEGVYMTKVGFACESIVESVKKQNHKTLECLGIPFCKFWFLCGKFLVASAFKTKLIEEQHEGIIPHPVCILVLHYCYLIVFRKHMVYYHAVSLRM